MEETSFINPNKRKGNVHKTEWIGPLVYRILTESRKFSYTFPDSVTNIIDDKMFFLKITKILFENLFGN